ncbi:hypothetical protein PS6_008542 [Mucor atramentarius]
MELASSVIMKTMGQDKETVLYGSIIYKTITTLTGIITASDTEDTFIHNCLHSLLLSIFSCDKYFIQEWANKSLESSPTYQPDWCASVKFWKNKYNIVATEAKPKAKQNRGIVSDYVKLGRELKLMFEKLIYSGVDNPEVYGLLVKGGVLEVYMMDIKVDGIYRFVKVDTVNLVTNFTEMTNLMRTLPILYQLKEGYCYLNHRKLFPEQFYFPDNRKLLTEHFYSSKQYFLPKMKVSVAPLLMHIVTTRGDDKPNH